MGECIVREGCPYGECTVMWKLSTYTRTHYCHTCLVHYVIPFALLLKHNGMAYHLYAVDTQPFQEFSLSDNTSPEIAIK